MRNPAFFCPHCSLKLVIPHFDLKKPQVCPHCHFKTLGKHFFSFSEQEFSSDLFPIDPKKMKILSAELALKYLHEGKVLEKVWIKNLNLSHQKFSFPLQFSACVLKDFLCFGTVFYEACFL
jgi:DNA-directed RNA polymerase subunit RPC12/RpoP